MSKRLFVGNLSFNTTEADLQRMFAPYSGEGATIPTDHDGRSKGFGFIEVAADQMSPAISALNGKELDGRALNVNEARPRPERSSGGYSGGNGGGSRGRW
ncbi:MAG: RNA recognition motif domain-containing protein [Armatimonadota bacterium]